MTGGQLAQSESRRLAVFMRLNGGLDSVLEALLVWRNRDSHCV